MIFVCMFMQVFSGFPYSGNCVSCLVHICIIYNNVIYVSVGCFGGCSDKFGRLSYSKDIFRVCRSLWNISSRVYGWKVGLWMVLCTDLYPKNPMKHMKILILLVLCHMWITKAWTYITIICPTIHFRFLFKFCFHFTFITSLFL